MGTSYGTTWHVRCPDYIRQRHGPGEFCPRCADSSQIGRQPVRRPQLIANRTTEAAKLYRLLTFRTHCEYLRSTPRQQSLLSTNHRLSDRSEADSLGHGLGRRPYQQGWYTSGRRAPRSPKHIANGQPTTQSNIKDASERYAEKISYLEQAHQALAKTDRNLYQFYLNIHQDQQFYFDGRRVELERILTEYAEYLENFFTGDTAADYWRTIMYERFQLEDEVVFFEEVVRIFLDVRAQNVLKWREVVDIEELLRERWDELRRRTGEYHHQAVKEKTFQAGCVSVDNFLRELGRFLDLVNSHIRDGGVDNFKWFQDPQSRKLLFYSPEREPVRRNSRKSPKALSPRIPKTPRPPISSQAQNNPVASPASWSTGTGLGNRRISVSVGPDTNVELGSDLPLRRGYSQSSPKAQRGPRGKRVSFQDLMETVIGQQTPGGDVEMMDIAD